MKEKKRSWVRNKGKREERRGEGDRGSRERVRGEGDEKGIGERKCAL